MVGSLVSFCVLFLLLAVAIFSCAAPFYCLIAFSHNDYRLHWYWNFIERPDDRDHTH